MKVSCLQKLVCPVCSRDTLDVSVSKKEHDDIRSGAVTCTSCTKTFPIIDGILSFLPRLSDELQHEKQAMHTMVYSLDKEKNKTFSITPETIYDYADILLSLPEGDGSYVFREGGLQNQAENAGRFYETVKSLQLRGTEEVLEVGASFGWASSVFAEKGCTVTALDVTDYLRAGDLYCQKKGVYFDRIWADMNRLPFKDNTFHVVFANSVLHHCMDLPAIFSELRRVLVAGGKLVLVAECSLGIWENRNNAAMKKAQEDGSHEQSFYLKEWIGAARCAGFSRVRLSFYSNIDDYIDKKRKRGKTKNIKFVLVSLLQKIWPLKVLIDKSIILFRWYMRPGNWKMICEK